MSVPIRIVDLQERNGFNNNKNKMKRASNDDVLIHDTRARNGKTKTVLIVT